MNTDKKKCIIIALATGFGYALFFKLNALFFAKTFPDSPLNGIVSRAIDTILLLILVFVFHKKDIFANKTKGFIGTFTTAGIEFVVMGLAILNFFFNVMGEKMISRTAILTMCIEMLFVGITEELISRGLVLGFFHDAFGSNTKKGAYLTAALSGAVFGCFHLLNLISATNKTAIYVQVIATACTGFMWGAVYLRKRNIFALMLIHALSDIAVMVSSGYLNGKVDLNGAINSMSPASLILAAAYVAAGIYILRDEKMHYTDESAPDPITAQQVS